jgi:adenylylsulfate kinase-like enzyme
VSSMGSAIWVTGPPASGKTDVKTTARAIPTGQLTRRVASIPRPAATAPG